MGAVTELYDTVEDVNYELERSQQMVSILLIPNDKVN